MKAFGYQAGYATVNYSWTGKEGCTPTTSGKGTFEQQILNKATNLVGTIPPNVENVEINLTSANDLDIQLYAQDGTAIARWNPAGLMAGAGKQSVIYHDMNITWSGYNGVDNQKGHEYITIEGNTTEMLTMKVYGYQAGVADVVYSWGDGAMSTIEISGKVVDLNNTPIANATVQIGTQTQITNLQGAYVFEQVAITERIIVNVSHIDYLKNSRVLVDIKENPRMEIKLDRAKATETFDASEGAVLTQADGATVELPSNGYVNENGTAYTGEIVAKVSYYPITTQSGRNTFPGAFEGTAANTTFPIQSYGFINVELTDTIGHIINLASGTSAILTYPVDTKLPSPSTIPLWYYNEKQNNWIKDGQAVLINNSYYRGTVHHFTSWSLGRESIQTNLGVCVQDINGNPVSGATVQFEGHYPNLDYIAWFSTFNYTTDNNGWTFNYGHPHSYPGNILVDPQNHNDHIRILAYTMKNGLRYTGTSEGYYNFTPGEDIDISECIVVKRPTTVEADYIDYSKTITVTGKLYLATTCEGSLSPVLAQNAYINISDATQYPNDYRTHILNTTRTDINGDFSIVFHPSHSNKYRIQHFYNIFELQENKTNYNIGTAIIPLCY